MADDCGRESTRDEVLDRAYRAEEAVRHLAFLLSDLHGAGVELADGRALAKRQLRACGHAAAGIEVKNGSAYYSEELSRVLKLREERKDLKYREEKFLSLLETAWSIIANVSVGDWKKQNDDWQTAAAKWRDDYHEAVPGAA